MPGRGGAAPGLPALTVRLPARGLLLRALAAVLLAAVTLLLYLGIGRFVESGAELLPPLDASGSGGWQRSGQVLANGPGGAALRNADPAGAATLSALLPVPPDARFLRLSAEIRMADVAGGRQLWESGRLILLSRDAPGGDWHYDWPHTVIRDTGTLPWQTVGRAFLVPAGGEVRVAAQLLRATGSLWVRNLSLRRADERHWFPPARQLLIALWVVGMAWILWPLARPVGQVLRGRRPTWRQAGRLAVLALVLAIAAAVLVPPAGKQAFRDLADAGWSLARDWTGHAAPPAGDGAAPASCGPVEDGAADGVAGRRPLQPGSPGTAGAAPAPDGRTDFVAPQQFRWLVADKLGHFAGFALLAFLSLATVPRDGDRRRWLLPILALPGFAALTEVWQVMATTRGASLADVAIDCAGLLAGALAWLGMRLLLWRLRPPPRRAA
ncbi:VanZ family protein [Marinibaculum pumilum]|uniref:VanZ family protein n=1 Tax=Marinibaculum pumilum TaxID=1766165 RepID=A0ABV7L8H3_9PROT